MKADNSNGCLEAGLPDFLMESINNLVAAINSNSMLASDYWSELNADINCAEVEKLISKDKAWYLRRKYLGMERD